MLEHLAYQAFAIAATATAVWLAVGESAAPGGPVFALECVFVCGVAGGRAIEALKASSGVPLPPLLGMLVAGLLLRNVPGPRAAIGEAVDGGSSASIRTAALALIMARAGLGLDLQALKRLKWAAARLASAPCLAEAGFVMVASSRSWVFGLPGAWAALLGFVVAAVSPAVVVPSLLDLQKRGYGTTTGIPTLVVASAALDDVLALAGFGVSLSFAVKGAAKGGVLPEALWADALRAPLELALGVAVALAGAGALRVAERRELLRPDPTDRAAALVVVSLLATFSLKRAGFSGASALATLALAARAAAAWGGGAGAVGAVLGTLWNALAQPLLFALLGVAVDLGAVQGRTAGLAVALIAASGAVRVCATSLAVAGFGLSKPERLFVALAWLPKATVQAAVGAVALDAAESDGAEDRARVVLTVAVLAIVLTAPLGAVLIAVFGPRLLTHDGAADGAENGATEAKELVAVGDAPPEGV